MGIRREDCWAGQTNQLAVFGALAFCGGLQEAGQEVRGASGAGHA